MKKKITIIDYGLGNLLSLKYFFEYLGYKTIISSKKLDSDIIILPGVGSMYQGMKNIKKFNIKKNILDKLKEDVTLVGICLGMHLMCKKGFEIQETKGLGIFNANVKKMISYDIKLPNVGKKKVNFKFKNNQKSLNDFNGELFYFNHSYSVEKLNNNYKDGYVNVKNKKLLASCSKNQIYGFQFHPEKSGEIGLEFFKNFIENL